MINTATRDNLTPHTGANYNVLNYGQLIAQSATEGVDAAQAQTLSDALTVFTPGEVVVNVVIGDRTISRVADPNLLGEVGTMAMNAIELREDQDGCAKFSSFTATLGATTVVATVGHFLAAEAGLRLGNSKTLPEPAPQPWFGVLHPNSQAAAAVKLIPLSQSIAANVSTLTSAEGSVGKLGATVANGVTSDLGVQVLMGKGLTRQLDLGEMMVMSDANCVLSGADAIGAFYSKKGLYYISEVTPYQKQERDESLRGVEITCVCSYAWGVYRPAAYGLKATFDATTPTS